MQTRAFSDLEAIVIVCSGFTNTHVQVVSQGKPVLVCPRQTTLMWQETCLGMQASGVVAVKGAPIGPRDSSAMAAEDTSAQLILKILHQVNLFAMIMIHELGPQPLDPVMNPVQCCSCVFVFSHRYQRVLVSIKSDASTHHMPWLASQAPVFSAKPEKTSDHAAKIKQPIDIAKSTEGSANAKLEMHKPTFRPKTEVRLLECPDTCLCCFANAAASMLVSQ